MRHLFGALVGFFIAVALVLEPATANARSAQRVPEVSSAEVVERPQRWDGRHVTFVGEVIGEAMVRGEVAWLHVNDDGYAHGTIPEGAELVGYNSGLAIIAPTNLLGPIRHFGLHDTRGDMVEVVGVFHAADPRYGGDMLIEAESVTVVADGGRIQMQGVRNRWSILLLSLITLLLAAILRRFRNPPSRTAIRRRFPFPR
jgi:hypothetical protein